MPKGTVQSKGPSVQIMVQVGGRWWPPFCRTTLFDQSPFSGGSQSELLKDGTPGKIKAKIGIRWRWPMKKSQWTDSPRQFGRTPTFGISVPGKPIFGNCPEYNRNTRHIRMTKIMLIMLNGANPADPESAQGSQCTMLDIGTTCLGMPAARTLLIYQVEADVLLKNTTKISSSSKALELYSKLY